MQNHERTNACTDKGGAQGHGVPASRRDKKKGPQ